MNSLIAVSAVTVLFVISTFVFASKRREVVIPFLVGVSAAQQEVQVAGLHLFVPAVGALILVRLNRDHSHQARWPFVTWLLPVSAALLASTAFFGELVVSRSHAVAIQLVVLSVTCSLLIVYATKRDWELVRQGFVIAVSIASAYGILQFIGILPMQLFYGTPRPSAFYVEPDWLGMYAAVAMVMVFDTTIHNRLRLVSVLLNAAAVVLAQARAPWIALACLGVAVLGMRLVQGRGLRSSTGNSRLVAFSIVAVLIPVLASNEIRSSIGERVDGLLNPAAAAAAGHGREMSAQARLNQIESLGELASQAPWNGFGLGASGRVLIYGGVDNTSTAVNNVASNWVLGWWVDGKLLALPLISVLGWSALRGVRVRAARPVFVVLFCSLFSNASYLPVTWMAVAMALSASLSRWRPKGAPPIPGDRATQRSLI